ncbi:hypothetical protein SOVF_126900, partial [Spinacia oleracea]
MVLALDLHDDKKCKKKVMKIVSSVAGIIEMSLVTEERKLILKGNMDPVEVVAKLRKTYRTEVVTIGPAEEPVISQPQVTPVGVAPVEVAPIVNVYMPYNPHYP